MLVGSGKISCDEERGADTSDILLQDGVWDGNRVLPEGWVKFSTTPGPYPGYGAGFWLGYPGWFP